MVDVRGPGSTLCPSDSVEVFARGFLITISGIDGSGKSSQAVTLRTCLSQQGIPATRAWVGHKPVLALPFLAFVRVLGYTHRTKVQGVSFYWRDIHRNRALSRVWAFILLLDFFPKALFSVGIPLLRGKTVVSDRYMYDMMAELSQLGLLGGKVKRIFLSIVPRPNVAFLMDVDENVAWKRSLIPGRAREQPMYDLGLRRKHFLRLAKELGMVVVDGSEDRDWNSRKILAKTLASMDNPANLGS